MTQIVTIVRGAASATKRGMVPFEPGLISLAFIPNMPFFREKNISHVDKDRKGNGLQSQMWEEERSC